MTEEVRERAAFEELGVDEVAFHLTVASPDQVDRLADVLLLGSSRDVWRAPADRHTALSPAAS